MRGLRPGIVSIVSTTQICLLDFLSSSIQLDVLLSPYLCYIPLLKLDLNVLVEDASYKLGVLHAN